MGLILPGNGDSASGKLIVPGGRRTKIDGPVIRYFIHDAETLSRLNVSHSQGWLNFYRAHPHICICGDRGFVCCLHCGRMVYDIQRPEDRPKWEAFLNDHINCRPAPEAGACGVFAVEAAPCQPESRA